MYIVLYYMYVLSQIWPVCNKGISQFYLPPTYEPYLLLLPSRKGVTALWLVLIAPTDEGMARLS